MKIIAKCFGNVILKKPIDFTQTTSIRTDVEILKRDAKLFANILMLGKLTVRDVRVAEVQ